jgi:hypothetical protein
VERRDDMNHITVGVYLTGDHKVNVVDSSDLNDHIEYNKRLRFGRALFLDGECIHEGYLSKDSIKEWENKISNMDIDSSKVSKIYH